VKIALEKIKSQLSEQPKPKKSLVSRILSVLTFGISDYKPTTNSNTNNENEDFEKIEYEEEDYPDPTDADLIEFDL
jgi:hypothetical protein